MIPILKVKTKKPKFNALKHEAEVINNEYKDNKIYYPNVIRRR